MNNNQETSEKSKLVNHDKLYIKTLKTIATMTSEEIERIVEEAKQGPTKYRSQEEAAVVAEICKRYATREIENISLEELFKRHIISQQGHGEKLSQYEYTLLAIINTATPINLHEIDFSEDVR